MDCSKCVTQTLAESPTYRGVTFAEQLIVMLKMTSWRWSGVVRYVTEWMTSLKLGSMLLTPFAAAAGGLGVTADC